MDGRKRPAAPRSRGNSPPTQRRRQSEQSSIIDRVGMSQNGLSVLPSPSYSRKNSAAGLAANMRAGPASYLTNEHHVDQNRRNIDRDGSHDPERVQVGGGLASSRKSSTDHSPRHVTSPMSNRSGSNTPVQVASIVPSMLRMVQHSVASQSVPMDTLSALRSHKAFLATSVAQATDGPTTQEVKVLKAQLRASQLRDAQLRSKLEKLESQLKQFEALPAQLAALKDLVEQQQQIAAKGPSPEDMEIRLSTLENVKPAIETAQFLDLQSDVRAMKTEAQKLDQVPEQMKQLQATVTLHGKEIADASSRNDKLKTEVAVLTSIKEEIKTIKKQQTQGQAMKGEAIRKLAQAAIQPEVVRWEAYQTEHAKIVADVATRVETNQRTIENMSTALEASQRTSDELKAFEKISNHTDKHFIDPKDFEELSAIVSRLSEETKKLTMGVNEIKPVIDELQHKSLTDSAQEVHTSLLDKHKGLTERVMNLEAAPSRSASPASHDQLKVKVEGIRKSQKSSRIEHDAIVGQIKAFENEQIRLSKDHNTVVGLVNKYHDEQNSLQTQQNRYQTEQDKLSEEQTRLREASESLEARLTAFDKIVDQIKVQANAHTDLSNERRDVRLRLTALETTPAPATDQARSVDNEHADAATSSSRIDGLEQRLRSMEDYVGGADGLGTRCNKIQNDIGEVEKDIEDCQSSVDLIQKSFVGIFGEIFDPFKATVERRLKEHAQDLTQTHEILAELQSKVEESQKECPAVTFSAPQLALIHNIVRSATDVRQDLSRLQDSVHMEAGQRNAAVEELKQQIAIKQDVASATQAIDVVKAAVRSLQNQYDNILTDDLHQKMVHWFMQNYSSPSANMLQQFAAIQHEITQLRKFTDAITQIPNGAQTVRKLAQLGPQLTALVQAPLASDKGSSEMLAKTNESLKSMSDSVTQTRKQHDSLAKVVGGLQTSMHSLNSHNTTLVRADSLAALETSIATLQGELRASVDNELRARKEFETKASREHDQRVHAETSIKTSIQDLAKKFDKELRKREEAEQEILSTSNEKFQELEKGQMKAPLDQMEKLQKALDQLRSDFHKALNDFDDPENKELFEWLPVLFLHVGQLQWVLEALNQNLPKGGLEIEWTSDWKERFSVPSPFPGSVEAAGNGRGRTQV